MPRIQYSLASLFGFTLACAAYMTTLVVLGDVRAPAESPWRVSLTLLVAWLLLAVFYVFRNARIVLVLHCFGFAAAVVGWPFLLVSMGTDLGGLWRLESARLFAGGIALCCLAGTLPSFPI